jgi:hypothetical protein
MPDPDYINEPLKVDADDQGRGGDDGENSFRFGVATRVPVAALPVVERRAPKEWETDKDEGVTHRTKRPRDVRRRLPHRPPLRIRAHVLRPRGTRRALQARVAVQGREPPLREAQADQGASTFSTSSRSSHRLLSDRRSGNGNAGPGALVDPNVANTDLVDVHYKNVRTGVDVAKGTAITEATTEDIWEVTGDGQDVWIEVTALAVGQLDVFVNTVSG